MKFIVTFEITHWKDSFFEQKEFIAGEYRRLFNRILDFIEDRWDINENVVVDILNITQVI